MSLEELFAGVLADHPAIVAGPAWCLCGWRPTAKEAAVPPFARKGLHRGHVAAQLAEALTQIGWLRTFVVGLAPGDGYDPTTVTEWTCFLPDEETRRGDRYEPVYRIAETVR